MKSRPGFFLLLCALGAALSPIGAQEVWAATTSRGTADLPSAGSAATPAPAPVPVEDAWNLFEDSQEGFSIELPNEWVVIRPDMEKAVESYRKKLEEAAVPEWLISNLLQKASEGQRVTAVHSVRSGTTSRGVASVMVSVKPLPAPVSSLYLAQVAAATMGEAAKSKDPIPVKTMDLPFGTAHSFTFSHKVKTSGTQEVEVQTTGIIFCQGRRAFIFECSSVQGESARYAPVFERVVKSLTLKPAATDGTMAGGAWKVYPIPSTDISMELPAAPELGAAFGQAVPPKDPIFVGRLVGYDCTAGPLRFYVLMAFHHAPSGPTVLGPFLEGPASGALLSLFPAALDPSGSPGGQSSAETRKAMQQNGYEAIRWELEGSHESRKVAIHCLVFATGGTAYLVAVYHPAGDAEAAKAAEKALASCKPEDVSEESMGQVAPFLREPVEEALLRGTWTSRPLGFSGFSLSLPESMELGGPNQSPPGKDSTQPRFSNYTSNAKGIGLIAQTISAKGAYATAATLLTMCMQGAGAMLVQMGFDLSKIKRTPVDANTIRIEASALDLTPKMHLSVVLTAREGRSCVVAFCYREGDTIAAQVAQKAFKSLK